MKPLRYFFYRNYQMDVRRRTPAPWFAPLLITSGVITLNLFAVAIVISELRGFGILSGPRAELRAVAVVAIAAVAALLYRRWIATGRYLQFAAEFRHESAAQRWRRGVYLWIYALSSILALPAIGYMLFRIKSG